ncbi:MAG: hypothetical protein R6X18_09390 [Chloroflexota bacterium]|jgi:hypothetical protein
MKAIAGNGAMHQARQKLDIIKMRIDWANTLSGIANQKLSHLDGIRKDAIKETCEVIDTSKSALHAYLVQG